MSETTRNPNILQIDPNASERSAQLAGHFNQQLQGNMGSTETAAVVTEYLFTTDPGSFDAGIHMRHRLAEARKAMLGYEGGETVLQTQILGYLGGAAREFEEGYAYSRTVQSVDGEVEINPVEINLPESVAKRSLGWNRWFREGFEGGGFDWLEGILADPTNCLSLKLASGDILPVGNLMVEVVQGVPRIQKPMHEAHRLTERWGLGADDQVVMTHIISKTLQGIASGIAEREGVSMFDGSKLTRRVYAQSYATIVDLVQRNPGLNIAGALSDGTWAYSNELARLNPRPSIGDLHGDLNERGEPAEGGRPNILGDVVDLGVAEELGLPRQLGFALQHPVLRAAYDEGRYRGQIASRFITPDGMELAAEQVSQEAA